MKTSYSHQHIGSIHFPFSHPRVLHSILDDWVLVWHVKQSLLLCYVFIFSFLPLFFLSLSLPFLPFLLFFGQLWSTVTQPLCSGSSVPWSMATASSLASLPLSGPLFYCPHEAPFRHLHQKVLLFRANPSAGFSSHAEPWPARLWINCFLANSLTWPLLDVFKHVLALGLSYLQFPLPPNSCRLHSHFLRCLPPWHLTRQALLDNLPQNSTPGTRSPPFYSSPHVPLPCCVFIHLLFTVSLSQSRM